jgi:hypothetical protein
LIDARIIQPRNYDGFGPHAAAPWKKWSIRQLNWTTNIAALGLAAASAAMPATSAEAAYKWTYRPLYVFAPNAAQADFAAQRAIVRASAGALKVRNVVAVFVAGDAVTADFGPAPSASAATLRQRFGVGQDAFRAILVGKDGGVKITSKQAIGAQRLQGVIDAMPMRRQEMRGKS